MVKLIKKLLYMDEHVCPPWASFSLDNGIRKLIHSPEKMLERYDLRGSTVLDVGCGPGFFSVAMAGMVGETGRVIAVDIEDRMLERLRRRAERAGVMERIEPRRCDPDDIGVTGKVDFALVFWMAHEVKNPEKLFTQIASVLKPGARVLLAEPKFHVTASRFRSIVEAAVASGLRVREDAAIRASRAVVFSF